MHKKRKSSGFHPSSRKPTKKVCDENERKYIEVLEKKPRARKNVFDGRGEFIRRLWKGHVMDINESQVNDSWYIEGTICLVNGWMCAKGMVFWLWAHERRH